MDNLLRASVSFAIGALSTSAYAIDCSRASARIDHLICADSKLLKADAAMGIAYSKILKAAPDPQIHAMLVASQKRWIIARNNYFGNLAGATNGMTGEIYTKAQESNLILHAIDERRRALASTNRSGQLEFVARAAQQQNMISQFAGGIFSGFDSQCEFIPSDLGMKNLHYSCLGVVQYQHENRICHRAEEWASWRSNQWMIVADINNGKPKIIKTCKDNECIPNDTIEKNRDEKLEFEMATPGSLKQPKIKLDAEVYDPREDAFWKACLTQDNFSPDKFKN